MRVDGRTIAEKIYKEVEEKIKKLGRTPALAVFYVGKNIVTDSFVSIKKKNAEKIGVKIEVLKFAEDVSENKLINEIKDTQVGEKYDGVIIQLPVPTSLNQKKILDAVKPESDVDVLGEEAIKLFTEGRLNKAPTVPGAINEIFKEHKIDLKNKKVAVLGTGKLVGEPVISWLELQGIKPKIFEKGSDLNLLADFDVIISGIGSPHSIKPEMIKEGVVLIDAGTSEQAGKVVGDFDPACEVKASLFTPVPGGVGPITVAMIFKNLVASV